MKFASPLHVDVKAALQHIEVSSSFHIPQLQIIGLPSPEIFEARERVRAAIEASGLDFPKRRIVINLSPASIKKRGTGVDLAIALSILSAHQEPSGPSPDSLCVAWGELSLNGKIQPSGKLFRTILSAYEARARVLLVSKDDMLQARRILALLSEELSLSFSEAPLVLGVHTLKEAWEMVSHERFIPDETAWEPPVLPLAADTQNLLPLCPSLERIVGVAAAGAHHVLLLGPRGTGKSHALQWLKALSSPPPVSQLLESALVAELREDYPTLSFQAPMRQVGMQVKAAALIGSASSAEVKPGEFSLAHGGLLLADEFPEWPRDARESLREPLEKGTVTLTRSRASVEFPARFQLAATGNLCPCGGWPPELPARKGSLRCRCKAHQRKSYFQRLSGPVMDRIDLISLVTHTPEETPPEGDAYPLLLKKVRNTQNRLRKQWGQLPGDFSANRLEEILSQNANLRKTLQAIPSLSLRSRHKTLRLALTLAQWDQSPLPEESHFFEASYYRPETLGLAL